MSLKKYLILMGISTIFCWLAWIFVLYFINPDDAGIAGFIFFYLSLFLALTGTLAILGLLLRITFKKDTLIFKQVNISSRQAVFYSMVVIIALILQSNSLLTWWNGLILIGTFTVFEFFFMSFKKFNKLK